MPWARSFWAFSPFLSHMRKFSLLFNHDFLSTMNIDSLGSAQLQERFWDFGLFLDALQQIACLLVQKSLVACTERATPPPPSPCLSELQKVHLRWISAACIIYLIVLSLFLILRKYIKSNLFMSKNRNFLYFFICSFLLISLMATRTLLKLRHDVSFTTSGRNFCCVGT